MSFSIYHSIENGLELLHLKEEGTGTEIALLPGHGAALHAFRVRQKGEFFNVVDNYHDLAEVQKEMRRSHKSPKLSPFPCRIPAGRYEFEGTTYQFEHLFSDGTAIHGLLADKSFTIVEE